MTSQWQRKINTEDIFFLTCVLIYLAQEFLKKCDRNLWASNALLSCIADNRWYESISKVENLSSGIVNIAKPAGICCIDFMYSGKHTCALLSGLHRSL